MALQYCDFELKDARVVVQGFGAVGRHAARFLTQRGAIIVGAADSRGTVYDPYGLDVDTLIMLKKEGKSVIEYLEEKSLTVMPLLPFPAISGFQQPVRT